MSDNLTKSHNVVPEKLQKETPRYAWVILVVTYLASLTAPLSQFKMTAIAGDIIAAYSLNYASFGMLMSCLAIIGALLAFPAAFIARKFGLRWTASAAMICVIVGGLIEVCTSNINLLYTGRFVEGVGLGLISVAGPTIISLWFPEHRRGLGLGIWCTWIPMAITIDFNLSPWLSSTFGWQSVFWAIIIFTLVVLIAFLVAFRVPQGANTDYGVEGTFGACFALLKNKYIWILAVCFLVFNFAQGGVVNTYYPSFLAQKGYSAAEAGFMTSVITIIGFIMNPISGIITERQPLNRKYIMITAFAILYILCFLIGYPSEGDPTLRCWAFVIMMGFAAAFGGGGSRPLAPSILSGSAMAATMSMAVMSFSMACGQMLAPLYGACLDAGLGWNMTAWVTIIPLSVVALVLSFFIKPGKR